MSSSTQQPKIVSVELVLPVTAIELLYDVLGHFPHDPQSWSNRARANCSVALWDAKNPEKHLV